ncbi:MAG: M48 family metalloprotease [Vicinamibacterales bacterium]
MKCTALAVAVVMLAGASAAEARQFDRLRRGAETAKKVADFNINDKDERAIGEAVGAKLIARFGIYQDPAVAKYVALVGTVLAQASSRPDLPWTFVVLDTEGVNAYAAPGGFIYITKGALGLFKTEAQLAGVLGHEITHITEKHTINAIRNAKIVDAGTDAAASARGGLSGAVLNRLSDASYDMIFENKFDRNDETASDNVGISLAHKAGYSPQGLSEFLTRLSERNKSATEPNGLFASHPMMKDRLNTLAATIKNEKLTSTATGQARYASIITFDAKPASAITPIEEGTRGVAGGGSAKPAEPAKTEEPKKEEPKKEEPKKRGFGIGRIASTLTGGKQAESTQASASAGGRMGVPDTNAPGGSNTTPVRVTITAADIAEFKKGIA